MSDEIKLTAEQRDMFGDSKFQILLSKITHLEKFYWDESKRHNHDQLPEEVYLQISEDLKEIIDEIS